MRGQVETTVYVTRLHTKITTDSLIRAMNRG